MCVCLANEAGETPLDIARRLKHIQCEELVSYFSVHLLFIHLSLHWLLIYTIFIFSWTRRSLVSSTLTCTSSTSGGFSMRTWMKAMKIWMRRWGRTLWSQGKCLDCVRSLLMFIFRHVNSLALTGGMRDPSAVTHQEVTLFSPARPVWSKTSRGASYPTWSTMRPMEPSSTPTHRSPCPHLLHLYHPEI